MNNENIAKDFEIELYRIDNSTRNDWCLLFVKENRLIRDTTKSKIFDILLHKEPIKFYNHFKKLDFENEKDIKPAREFVLRYISNNRDAVYTNFQNFLDSVQINIEGVTFKPNSERIIDNYLNIFKPKTEFLDIKPDIKQVDNYPHIKKIMENILGEGYNHFTKFIAWKLQNPCVIIPNHWIITDDGGTGKTELLVSAILDRLFKINILGQDDLASAFTGYMENTTMLVFEEIEGFDNQKKVKMITGAKYITINEKFRTPYRVENYNNCIFLSNDLKSLKIDDKDRRFNVVGGGKRLVATPNIPWSECLFQSAEENQEFFDGWHKHFDSELKSLYQHLTALEVNRNEVQAILNTQAKKDLQEINYTSEQDFLMELVDIGFNSFVDEYSIKSQYVLKNIIKLDNEHRKGYFISVRDLYSVYVDFCKQTNFTRIITKNHFIRRLKEISVYHTIFSEITQIRDNEGKNLKALEIYNYQDDNQDFGVSHIDLQ